MYRLFDEVFTSESVIKRIFKFESVTEGIFQFEDESWKNMR